MGWAGLGASGMKTGQYNEYLRAMQRVMEEGISKGFVRSSEQVAQNLTMLAKMTNYDPLWQGENGARRLSEMNAGLEGATALQSSSDILAFRAARTIAERRAGNKPVSYVEAQKVLEEGLTPELFKEYMKLASSAEGGGREGIIERMMATFGLNYTNADRLYQSRDKLAAMNDESLRAELNKYRNNLPTATSKEFNVSKDTQAIQNALVNLGIASWDKTMPAAIAAALEDILGKKDKTPAPDDVTPPRPYNGNVAETPQPGGYTTARVNNALEGYFSIGNGYDPANVGGAARGEQIAKEGVEHALSSGLNSFNAAERSKAQELVSLLEILPEAERKRLDRENTLNSIRNINDLIDIVPIIKQIANNTGQTAENTSEVNVTEVP
jgi:hypothetical protein